jgi:hypothetical protein
VTIAPGGLKRIASNYLHFFQHKAFRPVLHHRTVDHPKNISLPLTHRAWARPTQPLKPKETLAAVTPAQSNFASNLIHFYQI